jgi:hypothetical protein
MNVVIDGECWHSSRRNQAQSEAEGIMEAAKILNGQLHGYQGWRTAEIVLTNENCCDFEVNAHAGWLLENQNENVKVIDRRTQ